MTDRVGMLLRRAIFGPTATELEAARRSGYDDALRFVIERRTDYYARLAPFPNLGADPEKLAPRNPTVEQQLVIDQTHKEQNELLISWWLDRMTVADDQVGEKLVFFWHGHWATSFMKVRSAQLMLLQHKAIRDSPDFATMARRMVVDPALIYWLDGHLNTRAAPNENLGRELMELFMLGIGHYTETDVKEAGRALTGWMVDIPSSRSFFKASRHDPTAKTILGRQAAFTAATLVDHLLSQPSCPRFIAARLWFRYASPTTPIPPDLQEAMAASFPDHRAMLGVMLGHEGFAETANHMVKGPVEWVVGAARQLNIRPKDLPPNVFADIYVGLERLGQLPLAPPSVAGWPPATSWLSSAAAQIRLNLAGKLAALVQADRMTVEEIAHRLAIDVWTDRTYAVLKTAKNARQTITLALSSPEYLVS